MLPDTITMPKQEGYGNLLKEVISANNDDRYE